MSYLQPTIYPILSKTAGYSLTAGDLMIKADTTSAAITLTLPTVVGVPGKQYILKNVGTKLLTIATTSSQTIDGTTTYKLKGQNDSIVVVSDGSNWLII